MICPEERCDYENSEQGVKIHFGKTHEGTISGVIIECGWCGKETRRDEYRLERSDNLFCCSEHHDEWRRENIEKEEAGGWRGIGEKEFECDWCGETSSKPRCRFEDHDKHFCGVDCSNKWRAQAEILVGEKHPKWKDDTLTYGKGWNEAKREAVRNRDERRCRICGLKESLQQERYNGKLDVHHIVPATEFECPDERNRMGNLVALCRICHLENEGEPKEAFL